MSYETYYHLHWNEDSPTMEEALKALILAEAAVDPDRVPDGAGIREYLEEARVRWERLLSAWMSDFDAPWDNFREYLTRLSRAFPEATFSLQGTGAVPEDHWKEYYRASQTYQVKGEVTFPEFNPNRFEPIPAKGQAAGPNSSPGREPAPITHNDMAFALMNDPAPDAFLDDFGTDYDF